MEDLIVCRQKELNWSEKEMRKADPIELFVLLENYREFIHDQIKQGRLDSMTDQERKEFHQGISIAWGSWSHGFNKVVRSLVKEHELFTENSQERFMTKQYSIIYLFWWKCNAYIESVNILTIFSQAHVILRNMGDMEEVKTYFQNMKIEELPTWVKPVSI